MQPDGKQSQPGSAAGQQLNVNIEGDGKGKKPAVKKRTKTGCLSKKSSPKVLSNSHPSLANCPN